MTGSLDDLIASVLTLHPDGTSLDHLADAATVAAQLAEQSDALLDHFVRAARDAGVSWSQIGGTMGVSKQAAQQRFAARDLARGWLTEGQALFSRFPPRALNVVLAAWHHAQADGRDAINVGDLTAALLTEPKSMAVIVLHHLAVSDADVLTLVGAPAEPASATGPEDVQDVAFSADGVTAMKNALKAALAMGHNYIGTEHILLGLIAQGGPLADRLSSLGATSEAIRAEVVAQVKKAH